MMILGRGWSEHFIKDSHKAIFRTLDDAWGGGGQNPLFKIAAKQYLGCLMMLWEGGSEHFI